jgi:hypothetical protein
LFFDVLKQSNASITVAAKALAVEEAAVILPIAIEVTDS